MRIVKRVFFKLFFGRDMMETTFADSSYSSHHINDDHKDDACIGVVIVNYRTPALVENALTSLHKERSRFPMLHVVVVDNDSGDNSLTRIAAAIEDNAWSSWIKVVAAPINGGFAYGNNRGFDTLQAWLPEIDFYWLLNPDTEILPGATKALIDTLQSHPDTIVGSYLQDRDGSKQLSSFNFPSLVTELCSTLGIGLLDKLFANAIIRLPLSESGPCAGWLAGASLMFTHNVQRKIGYLDEEYFLYFEEVDYLLQAKKMGIPCFYVAKSKVIHEVGAATGISDIRVKQQRRPRYWFESRRRYFLKNHGRDYLLLADISWLLGHGLWYWRKRLTSNKDLDLLPPKLWRDFARHSQLNPANWFTRVQHKAEANAAPGLLQQVKEDWIAHGKDWTLPGFRAVAVCRFGQWRMTIRSKALRAPLSVLYRVLFRRVRNVYGIELPYTVSLGRRVIFEHQGAVVIHGHVVIGDDCYIRQGVTLGNRYLHQADKAPKLGNGVNVGAGAKLLGDVLVGDRASIGANAVVLNNVEPDSTVVGIPAKAVKLHESLSAIIDQPPLQAV